MVTLLPWLQFAPRDLERPLTTPVPCTRLPTPTPSTRRAVWGGSRLPVDPNSRQRWLLARGVWGCVLSPPPLPLPEAAAPGARAQGWQGALSRVRPPRMCTPRGGGHGTAELFHRIWLVLCVDAFRCLQLSPCRGTARLVRSSKGHGLKWRSLEARRKVQYSRAGLALFMYF